MPPSWAGTTYTRRTRVSRAERYPEVLIFVCVDRCGGFCDVSPENNFSTDNVLARNLRQFSFSESFTFHALSDGEAAVLPAVVSIERYEERGADTEPRRYRLRI